MIYLLFPELCLKQLGVTLLHVNGKGLTMVAMTRRNDSLHGHPVDWAYSIPFGGSQAGERIVTRWPALRLGQGAWTTCDCP